MASTDFSWQNSSGLKIFARDWPRAEPRGVVALVHGLGEHLGRYQHVAEALNAAGYALVAFDLPGHGQSGGTRGHFAFKDVLRDIDCLLEEAARRYPGKPQFLYGHSLGGSLALYYTLKRQPAIQGVISTSPGLAPGTPVSAPKMFVAKIMARIAPAFTIPNGLDTGNLSRDPNIARIYGSDPLVHARISARLGLDLINQGQWVLDNAKSFPLPLLLVQGSSDTLVSSKATQKFAETAPRDKVTYKVWEGFYHETHNEPEKLQVLKYMIDWLNTKL